jgi:hypothetical protein
VSSGIPTDLPIRCTCGTLRGIVHGVSGRSGNRVVCYCDACQTFANVLGKSDSTLDAQGGTDVFQMSPARLKLTQGREHLACLRLTASGPLRWYTDCCRTPIGNTLATSRVPLVGLIHSCMDTGGSPLDEWLGPVRARVYYRFARHELDPAPSAEFRRRPPNAHDGIPWSQFVRVASKILVWRLRGDQKRSPFFDVRTGEPVAVARVLSDDQHFLVD